MRNGVFLVGAGPGDKDLITVKGAKLLERADVVVYDHLANQALLDYAPDHCERIYVGKESGHHTMQQDKINELLVDLGRKYNVVVRLKGGDPYVFGRGSEEGEALYKAGIPFEELPGITSAIGGLAYAGIPITARGLATSFHVITGHISKNSQPIQFEQLAKINGTLVFLMGVANLPNIVEGLLLNGMNPTTPVAIIYKASTPKQRVIVEKLESIIDLANKEQIKPPSLIVVGEVVNFREELAFFEKRPLFGQNILVTRSRKAQSKMTNQLMDLGATVTQLPTIKIREMNSEKLQRAINMIGEFSGIIFTSGVAVELFFNEMKQLRLDSRHLYNQNLIAVGRETQKVLESYGIFTELVPKEFTKEGVRDLLKDIANKEDCYLVPRSARGDKEWLKTLEESCEITEIHCYDTVSEEKIHIDIEHLEEIDYMTFTSSSTVHGLMNLCNKEEYHKLKGMIDRAKIVAIGPITKATLDEYGIKVDLQPKQYTISDMVDCILEDVLKEKEID